MTIYSRRRQPKYSEAFKKSVVKEVMSCDEPMSTIANRYKISVRSIYRWLDCYEEGFISTLADNQEENKMSDSPPLPPNKDQPESDKTDLKVEQLQEALRLAKLKNEAYERLIKIAEEEYKISIKKKYGTKRSKK